MEIRKDIGTVIKSRRLEKNLSQEALSNSLLVERTLISKWENCKALPTADRLPELCLALDIEPNDLYSKEGNITMEQKETDFTPALYSVPAGWGRKYPKEAQGLLTDEHNMYYSKPVYYNSFDEALGGYRSYLREKEVTECLIRKVGKDVNTSLLWWNNLNTFMFIIDVETGAIEAERHFDSIHDESYEKWTIGRECKKIYIDHTKIKEVLDATFISTSHNLIDEHGVIKRVLEDIVSMYKSENLRYTQEKQKHPEKKGLVLYSQKYKSSFITCEDFNKLEIPPQSDVKATFYKFNTENSFPANVCFAYSPEEEEDDYSPYEVEAYKVYKDSFVIKRNVYVQDEENGYYKYAGKETLNPDEYFVFVPDNKLLAVYDNGINPEYIRHKNYWDRLEDDKKPVDIDAAVESCRNLYESEKQVVREAIEKLNSYYGKDYNMFFININALENSLASKNIEAIQKELASLKDAESKNAVYEKMLSDKKEKKNELTESMLKEAKDRLVLIKRDNTEQLKKYIYQIIDFAMAGNETNTNVFLHYLFYCYDSIPDPVDKIAVTVCHVKNIIDIRKEKEKKDGYILSHPGYDKQTKYIEKIFAEYTNALFGRTDL